MAGQQARCNCGAIVTIPGGSAPANDIWGAAGVGQSSNVGLGGGGAEMGNAGLGTADGEGEYNLAAEPASQSTPNPFADMNATSEQEVLGSYSASPGKFASAGPANDETNSSVLGGIGAMVFAALLFFGGLAFGVIFLWAPVIFIAGLIAVVRGLVSR